MRYWSTTYKQWQTLIVATYALTDAQSGRRREDFKSDEMKEGKELYFEQVDNLSGRQGSGRSKALSGRALSRIR
jgi:hypothetical protein